MCISISAKCLTCDIHFPKRGCVLGRWCMSVSELTTSGFIIWLRQLMALEYRLYGDVYIKVHNYFLSHYIIDTLRSFLETNIGEMHWYSYITKSDLCLLLLDSPEFTASCWQPSVSGEWRVHYFCFYKHRFINTGALVMELNVRTYPSWWWEKNGVASNDKAFLRLHNKEQRHDM